MNRFILPSLERTVFKETKNKNLIKQVIVPARKVDLVFVSLEDETAIFKDLEEIYCITNKSSNIPVIYDYIILSNEIPNNANITSNSFKLKKWLKHPKIEENYGTNEVIDSWTDQFISKLEEPDKNISGLRKPQLGALHTILGHFHLPLDIATVVLPTGTGKTETMLSAMVAYKCKKILVTVPSDSLRTQISEKFLTLGLLKEFEILGKSSLFPIVGIVKEHFKSTNELNSFFSMCNVVVSTMTLMADSPEEQQLEMSKQVSHVFIDEAHHIKASTWEKFRLNFENEKIMMFTATPFRQDGKRLDGKIIFNFPLLNAQKDGYFKEIEFIAVSDYDSSRSDFTIAEKAVQRLEDDHVKGFPHILMARCATKERANFVFEIYKKFGKYNPVIIHSTISNKAEVYQAIIDKHHKIIVCVDMLGEGFDLPQLKIAAFHDIRKSLPITLQFIGRFTRTKHDQQLGKASCIANIADLKVTEELEELYARDADWNKILSDISHLKIDNEIKYKELIEGFTKINSLKIPFQNITPKLSAVVYKTHGQAWYPDNFYKGIKSYNDIDYKFFDVNRKENIAIFVFAKGTYPDWINHKKIYNLNWDIIVMFWDDKNELLFINSSDNGSVYKGLAKALIGEDTQLIEHMNVFKVLHGIDRISLQNVGLKLFLGRDISFRMSVGSDVAEALTLAEKQNGQKSFVVGSGYEHGNKINIGCSYKGRIWTKKEADLLEFKEWCTNIGKKLVNDKIDPNIILRETLIPQKITERPAVYPVWIELDSDMLQYSEIKYSFIIDGTEYNLSMCEINLIEPTLDGDLLFCIDTEDGYVTFRLSLFKDTNSHDIEYPNYKIHKISKEVVEVRYGSKQKSAVDFFEEYIPTIWFADGSALIGNDYIQLRKRVSLYPAEQIIIFDWAGIDLSKESQKVYPKITDSIQYRMIEELKKIDYDIIYDDDYKGEIADIVTIKVQKEFIEVELYHLKFSNNGLVNNQIKNFYEVCGQAQKSVVWKRKGATEILTHLLRREPKKENGLTSSRFEKGTIADLEKILDIAKKKIPIQFKIYIVQPSLSKANPSEEILQLLGVTSDFIKATSDIKLEVISSA
ncbi:hypothetical protein PTI45_01572 [Paenibacillus nuruki]|uniref:Helicase ATP-binding domain-containing protein n=1 Tax=Paenibacillus nuruki TaxID=1886670 RepID=A0A1E3L654_9BACL|nr:DEAD/DEAH box helicase family protein [Paenibacillus nuruki]ODP29061.1 hypothetical protein PTI45_01572 [Paenibacillus nuruki]